MMQARELNAKAKGAVKDLASHVAKALAKKVDRTDLKRMLKDTNVKHQKPGHPSMEEPEPVDDKTYLLSKSTNQWIQSDSGPLSKSQLVDVASDVNLESVRNEEELRGQLGLVQDHLKTLKAEMVVLQRAVVKEKYEAQNSNRNKSSPKPDSVEITDFENKKPQNQSSAATSLEWKLALNELSANLRREMCDKVGREEMQNTVRCEVDQVDERIIVSMIEHI